MQVDIQPNIEKIPGLRAAVDQATQLLAEELGPSAPLIRVVWDTSRDPRDRLSVDLSLMEAGWTGEVSEHFAPKELTDVARVKERLHRLWGELLRQSSREQFQKLVKRLLEEKGR
jgi:hypothetical protein